MHSYRYPDSSLIYSILAADISPTLLSLLIQFTPNPHINQILQPQPTLSITPYHGKYICQIKYNLVLDSAFDLI